MDGPEQTPPRVCHATAPHPSTRPRRRAAVSASYQLGSPGCPRARTARRQARPAAVVAAPGEGVSEGSRRGRVAPPSRRRSLHPDERRPHLRGQRRTDPLLRLETMAPCTQQVVCTSSRREANCDQGSALTRRVGYSGGAPASSIRPPAPVPSGPIEPEPTSPAKPKQG